jgi:hypothetical protein
MVQTDVSQLSGECNAWRGALRSYRDELCQDKNRLQQVANHHLSKDQLQELEHLQNQLHIQLINIHDLKQAVKVHERKINLEPVMQNGQLHEEVLAEHESLNDQYQMMGQTLSDLRSEFENFLEKT